MSSSFKTAKQETNNTSNKFIQAFVSRVKNSGTKTTINLSNGEVLSLPPYLYIAEGNQLEYVKNSNNLFAVNKITEVAGVERIKLFPSYRIAETLSVPPHNLKVIFRERQSSQDLKAIKLLEQFHYRGNGLNKIVGRRTVLLAEIEGVGIVGYGVLSATVLACKPRFELFEVNFKKQMDSKLINKLARIPRVVVHPEYRGLGLGGRIAKHLTEYAKDHWDIKGYKPVLIEVIASMTEYHKFFEVAGFISAGRTEGKATIFKPQYGHGGWQTRENSSNYKFTGPLGPKPYLVYPLTKETENLVQERVQISDAVNVHNHLSSFKSTETLQFKSVSVNYVPNNSITERTERVRTVFGIDDAQLSSPILRDFNLSIEPGDVMLITGGSGTGKSTLLKLLTGHSKRESKGMIVTGEVPKILKREIISLPIRFEEKLALVDQVGEDLDESIALLNSVGLAEAHLYLKTPKQISEGQRYRFSIAKLCGSKKKIWVADEFASTLDAYTAAVVAKGIRKQATKAGATLIVAAPYIENFLGSLLPTKIVRLKWGGLAQIDGIKLEVIETLNQIEIIIRNTGERDLHDIRLVVCNTDGGVFEIVSLPEIKVQSIFKKSVSKSYIPSKGGLIRVTSHQGVGDNLFVS